jgi:hypothetical protein
MILEPNPERRRKARTGYGAAGLQLDLTYLAQGFQSIPVSLDSELLYAASPQSFPSVIHVAAQLSESYQPREVLLGAGESADAVRPDMLISLFSRWPEDRLRPFVILECIESPSDRGRGLLLRNALASRLFAECTRGVLAIGPYPKGWLNQTIKALLSKMHDPKVAIGDLHTAFWAEVRYPPPALFTLDPDLPVWER